MAEDRPSLVNASESYSAAAAAASEDWDKSNTAVAGKEPMEVVDGC